MSRMLHAGLRLSTSDDLLGGRNGQSIHRLSRRLVCLVIACSLLVALLTALVLRREYQEQMQFWHEKLTRAADANQRLLENWIKERNEDTQLIASFPCTAIVAMSRARGDPAPPQPCRKRLQEQLIAASNIYSYAGVYVLGGGGRVLAQSSDSPPLTGDVVKGLTVGSARAMAIPEPVGRAGYSRVAFGSPILHRNQSAARGEAAKPIGHVVLVTRRRAVAALLWTDTGATATGETLMVTLQAGQPIFISPLRNWKGQGTLTAPAPGPPAQVTLLQKRNFYGRYTDYRGASVLVATRFLPDLGWGMVTKVDSKEVLSAFQQTLVLGVSIALLAILTIVSAAVAWLRHQRVQRLQTDLAHGKLVEENLRRSEERFWVALDNSPVIVFNQDRELRYTWINKPFPPWSGVDYLGKTDEEIIGVEDGSRLSALKRPVLESGTGVRKEWSFVYRGQRHDFDVNIQPLRNQAGEVVGITCASIDITERKRAEERLREYEKVVEGLEEMIVVIDRNYRYLIANRAFLTYRGLHREQLIGHSVAEVLNPGVFETFLKAKLDRCLEGHTVIFEMRHNYPHLGERDLLISYFPIEGRDGVDRVACVLQDITDRKRAEKALRDSETRYRLRFERNPAGMFRCSLDGKLLGVNEAFARIYGYASPDEVLRFPIVHFYMRPEEREPLVARLRQQGSLNDFEFCGRHRDGTPIWLLANVAYVPEQNGAPGLVEGTFINVTRRKNAEAALLRSEAQLRAFRDNAPYGIFRYAGDHFLSANPALVQMLGYVSEAEVLALNVSADVFDPSAEYRDLMALSGQQLHFGPVEAKWRRRDGTLVLARLRGRVAQNGEKIIEAIAEDITQQRALEEQLGQSDRLGALGRLASGVAHDINNLLLGITLNLERAIRGAGPADSPLREDIEQSLQAARGAAAVIRQLLVFGRKRSRQQQPVNLNDVIIRSLDLVHHLAGENIHVNLRLGPNLGPVSADPVQVQQVVLNLVANARDAMAGKGQITISTRNIDLQNPPPGEYFTATPQAGNYVVLEVSDTGTGISREALAHIFEPFYTTKKEGSGLGLSTSYGIVTQNSGYMSVRTELGLGTTVRSYLPRLAEDLSLEAGLRRVS